MGLAAWLNIHSHEKRKLLLCLLYSVAIGICQCFVVVIPLSIFLEIYDTHLLPYVYAGTAIATILTGTLYSYVARKVVFYTLFSLLILFILSPLLVLNLLILSNTTAAVIGVFLLLVWAQSMISLSDLAFWGLMNHLFNLSQAKRLYGLIGAASSFAMILTGLAIPLLIDFLPVKIVLSFSCLALCGCLVILWLLKNNFPEQMLAASHEEKESEEGAITASSSNINFLSSIKSPYILTIFIICFLTATTFLFVDMVFNISSKEHFVTEQKMASFFGLFYACANAFEILARLLLFPALLRRFGVITAAAFLPLLAAGVTLTALFSQLWAFPWIAALFFWLMVLNRFFQEVLRYAILEPARLLMYQLFVPSVRIWIHSKAETFIYPLATMSSALIILVSGWFIEFQVIILLVLIGFVTLFTLYCMYSIKKPYIAALSEAIGKRYYCSDTTLPLDKNTQTLLEQHIHSPHPGEAIYSLETLEKMNTPTFLQILPSVLNHPSDLVREFAIKAVQKYELKQLYPDVLHIATDGSEGALVRKAALLTLAALASDRQAIGVLTENLRNEHSEIKGAAITGLLKYGDAESQRLAFESLASLITSREIEARVQAASVVGDLPGYEQTSDLIKTLFEDPEVTVQKASLIAGAKSKTTELYPHIVSSLEVSSLKTAAGLASMQLGEALFLVISSNFPSYSTDLQRQVLHLLGQIHISQEDKLQLIRWLLTQLYQHTPLVDAEIWGTLFQLGYHVKTEEGEEAQQLHGELEKKNEELTYLIRLRRIIPIEDGLASLASLMDGQMRQVEQNIYQLLSFRYPKELIRQISQGMGSSSEDKKGYAMEMIQNLLKKEHSTKILDLIMEMHFNRSSHENKSDSSPQALGKTLEQMALNPQGYLSRPCQAAALYFLAKLSLPVDPDFFKNSLFQTDILLRETADWAQVHWGVTE